MPRVLPSALPCDAAPAAASEKVELLLVVSNPGDDDGTPESVERHVVSLDAEDEPQHSVIVVAEEDE